MKQFGYIKRKLKKRKLKYYFFNVIHQLVWYYMLYFSNTTHFDRKTKSRGHQNGGSLSEPVVNNKTNTYELKAKNIILNIL